MSALPGIPRDEQRLLRELDDARALAACELGAVNRATVYLTVRNPRRQIQAPMLDLHGRDHEAISSGEACCATAQNSNETLSSSP